MAKQTTSPSAIVTGAAGGMGAACARLLAKQGYSLILCDLQADPLEAIKGSLGGGGSVESLAGDISDPAYIDRLVALLGNREVAALIHCAGLSPTMADGNKILEVNFHATARLVDALEPKMADGGCAVLIASMAAHMIPTPEADEAVKALLDGTESPAIHAFAESPSRAYPLSKRAVVALAARRAKAFGERGARIVSLCPGSIDTPMGRAEQTVNPQMDSMMEMSPISRWGRPEEIANVAVFLCSPEASFMTGVDVRVDGGCLAAMGL